MRKEINETVTLRFSDRIAKIILRLMGWKTKGQVPPYPKYVMIGYPHTSNWDAFVGLVVFKSMGVHLKWLAKKSLFKWPLSWILKWAGAVPIQREKSQNLVQKVKEIFNNSEQFVLTLSPEGTRKKTDYWRTGFYYMALEAGVPIALSFLDYPNKTGGFGPVLWPSGDIEKDMETIREFYKGIHGKFPEQEGAIRIKPRNNHSENSEEEKS